MTKKRKKRYRIRRTKKQNLDEMSKGVKTCSKCNKIKSRNSFSKRKRNKDGLVSWCKSCRKEYQISYYKNRSKKWYDNVKTRQRASWLKTKYNLTIEEYNKILHSQGSMCAICDKPQSKEKVSLAVDHNHKTSHIRGLLCNYCNAVLLKHLRDNKKRAEGLVKYLSKALKEDKSWRYNNE